MTRTLNIFSLPRPARLSESVRARLRSPDIPQEDVRAILAHYGLELTRHPANLSASRRNHNVTVETAAGRKLLKRYRPQWRRETVIYGHAILDRLVEVGFPVPRLAVTLDGESFVAWADHHYALLEFVEGVSYSGRFLRRDGRRRLMALAGQTLARLHRALQGFTPAGRHHLGFAAYDGWRQRDAAWHLARASELAERSLRLTGPEEQPTGRWLATRGRLALEQIVPLEEELAAAPLTRTIIHGDYGLHNLLFRHDGTVAPVDFELARLEWRLSDLVSCLSRFRYGEGPYDFESIRWFLGPYNAEFPLSVDEWRLFPQVWRFYKLQGAVQYWSSFFETGGPTRKLFAARDAIEQAEWVAGQPQQLRAQLGEPAGL